MHVLDYCSINGVPSCANKKLLTDILRNEWNFKGTFIYFMLITRNEIKACSGYEIKLYDLS